MSTLQERIPPSLTAQSIYPSGTLFVETSKKGWFADVRPGEESKREVLAVIPVELQDGNHDSSTEWGCYPDAESIRGLSEWLDGIGEILATYNSLV